MAKHLVVELPQIEPASVPSLDLSAQSFDFALPQLVGERLARPCDVAVRLNNRIGFGQAHIEQEIDRTLAIPAQPVHPGVDDEPSGAPGLRVEHAEPLGLRAEEPHLVGQPLRVEAPALDICPAHYPCAQPAEGVEVRVLHLQRDLEVVAGDGLVVRGRRKLGVLAARKVVSVGVVDPGSGTVLRRREVIGEGGVLFLELLDCPHLASRLWQATEIARRQGHSSLDVLACPGQKLLLRLRRVRRIDLQGRPIAVDVVAEALRSGDRTTLLVDAGDLGHADLVHLVR